MHSNRIIRVDPSKPKTFDEGIKRAAELLRMGGLVAYPTESFYGLAADATNEKAIKRLFSVKGRQSGQPVLIIIPSPDVVDRYVLNVPVPARRLMDAFWPGGLTLVFEAGSNVSPLLTAGTNKIGIRYSSHPLAVALGRALDSPITGTSANISGKPACSSAEAVLEAFGKRIDLVLDGGKTEGKIGSTVLDVTEDPPSILREGMVSRKQLEKFIAT